MILKIVAALILWLLAAIILTGLSDYWTNAYDAFDGFWSRFLGANELLAIIFIAGLIFFKLVPWCLNILFM